MSHSIAFDRAAGFYDATRGFPPGIAAEAAARLAEAAGLTTTSQVLEIGIGTGRIALPLSHHAGAYVGVDLSRPMLAVLREKQQDEPITLIEGDVTRLPMARESFDLAISIHVLHLIEPWRQAVAEMVRVVRPTGAIIINADGKETDEVVTHWNGLLAAQGYARTSLGERDADVIGMALAEHGFTERFDGVAAEWQLSHSPASIVDQLAQRFWSSTWAIPDTIFQPALQELRAWVASRYPDPNEAQAHPASFRFVCFRRPTSA